MDQSEGNMKKGVNVDQSESVDDVMDRYVCILVYV